MSGRDARRGPVNSTLSRGYGTLAGLGIIGAAVLAVPSTLFLDPRPEAEAYFSTIAALAIGLVCMALPWERIDARWLHLVGVVAIVQAAVAVVVFGQVYVAFYFLIAVAAAYMTATWKELAAQLALIGVALFGPVAWGPTGVADTLQLALLVFPLLCLMAGTFAYLRHRMVADQSSYRVFAEETLSLATRIAGRPVAPRRSFSDDGDLPSWSHNLRVSARAASIGACVLALPLLSSGLAAAGVKLPGFASDTLGGVGIDLPNQGSSHDEAVPSRGSPRSKESGATRLNAPRSSTQGEEVARSGQGSSGGGGKGRGDDPVSGSAGPSSSSVPASPDSNSSASPPVGSEPGGPPSAGPSEPPVGGSGSVGDVLDDTVGGLDGLLNQGQRSAE
ncbi:MAG TPA: hypothetical protein VD766_12575 [Solirubrobacterales bacterium]|nr:hypothetical protein [Solirubrobacterales bacterium]